MFHYFNNMDEVFPHELTVKCWEAAEFKKTKCNPKLGLVPPSRLDFSRTSGKAGLIQSGAAISLTHRGVEAMNYIALPIIPGNKKALAIVPNIWYKKYVKNSHELGHIRNNYYSCSLLTLTSQFLFNSFQTDVHKCSITGKSSHTLGVQNSSYEKFKKMKSH